MQIINEMLAMVKTDIVFNYDCDVLLQIETYEKAVQMIRDGYDIVYPYGFGNYQKQVNVNDEVVSEFLNGLDFSVLDAKSNIFDAQYGHVQVLSTKSYFDAGMENENFKGSSPEDKERFYRFNTLGYRVGRIDDFVYHLEHSRGENSWPISAQKNPHMANNFALWEDIQKMSVEELRKYYVNVSYLKKYKKSVVVSLASPGLANRMKTYISSLAKYDVVKTCREIDTILFGGLEKVSLEDKEKYPQVDGWRLEIEPHEEQYIDTYKTVDLLYEKTPEYFIEKYSKVIPKLKINPEILKVVDDFTSGWQDAVGVHIRSWYCSRRVLHENKIFEEYIDKLDKNKKFFLCSDNSDVQSYFIEKYGDRVITFDRKVSNNPYQAESGHHDDMRVTADALIELLILSRCAKIIATFASSYDEVAWWLGECKSEVIVPTPNNIDEYQKMYNLIFLKK